MDSAITESGQIVKAIDLNDETPEYRNQYKGKLFCGECKKQAFFRKSGKNARKACMFASHADDCSMDTNRYKRSVYESDIIKYVDEITIDDSHLKLKFPALGSALKLKSIRRPTSQLEQIRKPNSTKKTHLQASDQTRVATYDCREILKWLIYTDFSVSNKQVELEGYSCPAKYMFSNIATLNLDDEYWINGVWSISKNQRWRTKWLFGTLKYSYENFFYFEATDTALVIDINDAGSSGFPFEVEDYDNLNGCHILLKADVFKSKSGKWYLKKHFRDNYWPMVVLDPIITV